MHVLEELEWDVLCPNNRLMHPEGLVAIGNDLYVARCLVVITALCWTPAASHAHAQL